MKKLLLLGLLSAVFAFATENTSPDVVEEENSKCSAAYESCVAVCDKQENLVEACYTKCEEQYDKCVEESENKGE